jgi:hypothetical protein
MPKATTTKAKPRKALGEASASVSNHTPQLEEPTKPKKSAPKAAAPKRASANEPPAFVTEVILPGEESVYALIFPEMEANSKMSVPVFDDCRTLRRKINAYLTTGVKKTHFLKWIGGSSAVSLKNFLSKTGIMEGSNMDIYYQLYLSGRERGTNCRYVFFEKMRVFEGKAKTELRLKQEQAFRRGRDLQSLKRTSLWLMAGEYTEHDELGRLVIIRQGGKRQVLD